MPLRAEIAKAQDALAVGDDDQLGLIGPVAEQFGDAAAIVGADEHAARPLEDQAETLAGEADRRRIDQRLDFVDVVADDAEEQRLVAVVQRIQRDIFFEVVGQAAQVGQDARHLLFHRKHVGRQKAAQAQLVPLGSVKAVPLLRSGSRNSARPRGRVHRLRIRSCPDWRGHDVSSLVSF